MAVNAPFLPDQKPYITLHYGPDVPGGISHSRHFHFGADFFVGNGPTEGAPVHAPIAGTVHYFTGSSTSCKGVSTPWNGPNGVAIEAEDGTTHYFGHLSARVASDGAHVSAGDVIGKAGNLGCSWGAHCHWGISAYAWGSGGSRAAIGDSGEINPEQWLKNGGGGAISGVRPGGGGWAGTPSAVPPPKPAEPTWETQGTDKVLDLTPFAIEVKHGSDNVFWIPLKDVTVSDNEGGGTITGSVTSDSYNEDFDNSILYNRFKEVLTTKQMSSLQNIPTGRPITFHYSVDMKKVSKNWSLLTEVDGKNVGIAILRGMKDKDNAGVDQILAAKGAWRLENGRLATNDHPLMQAGKPIKHNALLGTDNTFIGTTGVSYVPELWSGHETTAGSSGSPSGVVNTEEAVLKILKNLGMKEAVITALMCNFKQESNFNSAAGNHHPEKVAVALTEDIDYRNWWGALGIPQMYWKPGNPDMQLGKFGAAMNWDGTRMLDGFEQLNWLLKTEIPAHYRSIQAKIDELNAGTQTAQGAHELCAMWLKDYEAPGNIASETSRRCGTSQADFDRYSQMYKNI